MTKLTTKQIVKKEKLSESSKKQIDFKVNRILGKKTLSGLRK